MKKWLLHIAGFAAIASLYWCTADAVAETCKLEIKKVDTSRRGRSTQDRMFGYAYPQRFFQQLGSPAGVVMANPSADKNKPEFSKVIKKEPAKYVAEHPFRGVAKLGSHYYGFVFDAAPPTEAEKLEEAQKKKEAEKKAAEKKKSDAKAEDKSKKAKSPRKEEPKVKMIAYSRLYFDLNHNGDLTDDKVIEATPVKNRLRNYSNSTFPRVDISIEVDGKSTDYAFSMSVYMRSQRLYAYARAQLSAAAYREGEIVLDGKKYRVVLVDFNSNGLFNDPSKINKDIRASGGVAYPTYGDRLFIIDAEAQSASGSPYDVSSNDSLHFVAKLVNLGGKFHDLKIAPSGNELTLAPSSLAVGHVTNPNKGYRAIVYDDQSFLKIADDKTGKAALPEGEWKLLSYTIDQTKKPEAEKPKAAAKDKDDTKPKVEAEAAAKPAAKTDAEKKAEKKAEAIAKLKALAEARRKARPRPTTISARGTKDYKPVKVVAGKTVALPFGPPYRAIVKAGYPQGDRKVSLSMSLVGVADEICSGLSVDGRRPKKPHFTISTKEGKEVATGDFEYG